MEFYVSCCILLYRTDWYCQFWLLGGLSELFRLGPSRANTLRFLLFWRNFPFPQKEDLLSYGLNTFLPEPAPYPLLRPPRKNVFGGEGPFPFWTSLCALFAKADALQIAVSASTCDTTSFTKLCPNRYFPALGNSPLAYFANLGSTVWRIFARLLSLRRLFALPSKTRVRWIMSKTTGACTRSDSFPST